MNSQRLQSLTRTYRNLKIAVVGDFCLDRYLEIDPKRHELSIETGLPVHNVVRIRSQPGAAGTILNNLLALEVGALYAVGFCGDDGEGFELRRALKSKDRVNTEHFITTGERQTFTYTKPLVIEPGKPPIELNRLDIKNWTPTPDAVAARLQGGLLELGPTLDAIVLMDQVDIAGTGVISAPVLKTIERLRRGNPELLVIGDSRRSLRDFPPLIFKMNRAELARYFDHPETVDLARIQAWASQLAATQGLPVFVTLASDGILAADPGGQVEHVAALAVRGEIDIVGAGDAVTANLIAALASGATLREAAELAMLASSIVIHQLGTTGTASPSQLHELLQKTAPKATE